MIDIEIGEKIQHRTTSRYNALWWRIAALLIIVFAGTLLLISFLNYSNYRKTYLNLNQTRYLVSIKELRNTIEYGLNIGLPPSANMSLLPALEDLTKRQAGIRYIAIVDDSGSTIGTGVLPNKTVADWQTLQEKTPVDLYWEAASLDTLEIGMPFVNSFSSKAGVVVIGYDKTVIDAAIEKMLRKLSADFAITLSLFAGLTVAVVYVLTKKFSNALAGISEVLDSVFHSENPPTVTDTDVESSVAKDINDFIGMSQKVAHELIFFERKLSADGATANGNREEPA